MGWRGDLGGVEDGVVHYSVFFSFFPFLFFCFPFFIYGGRVSHTIDCNCQSTARPSVIILIHFGSRHALNEMKHRKLRKDCGSQRDKVHLIE